MTDLFSKFDPLIQQREGLLATGVRDPFSLVMEEVKSPTVAICNGRETILLGTYNYMGMTFDPDVIAAGKQALDDFGAGGLEVVVCDGRSFAGPRLDQHLVAVLDQFSDAGRGDGHPVLVVLDFGRDTDVHLGFSSGQIR